MAESTKREATLEYHPSLEPLVKERLRDLPGHIVPRVTRNRAEFAVEGADSLDAEIAEIVRKALRTDEYGLVLVDNSRMAGRRSGGTPDHIFRLTFSGDPGKIRSDQQDQETEMKEEPTPLDEYYRKLAGEPDLPPGSEVTATGVTTVPLKYLLRSAAEYIEAERKTLRMKRPNRPRVRRNPRTHSLKS